MTGRKLTPDALPGWPRRLGLELAAAYLGISPSKLLEGEGKAYPAAVRDGRRKLWDRQALDAWVDAGSSGEPASSPFAEAVRARRQAHARQRSAA